MELHPQPSRLFLEGLCPNLRNINICLGDHKYFFCTHMPACHSQVPPSKRHRALSHSAVVYTGNLATVMCLAGSKRTGGQAGGGGNQSVVIKTRPAIPSLEKLILGVRKLGRKEERVRGREEGREGRTNKGVSF